MKYSTGARNFDKQPSGKSGISRAQIDAMRKQIRVGDQLLIVTQKGASSGAAGCHGGVERTARVVNTSSEHFCVVEFSKGARDAVLWTDIMTGKAIAKQSNH